MSNWSITKNEKDHSQYYPGLFKFQAACENDKRWALLLIPKSKNPTIIFNSVYRVYNCKAANTKPEYTPEQQEMLDWIENETKNWIVFCKPVSNVIKDKYIEIINKHRSK